MSKPRRKATKKEIGRVGSGVAILVSLDITKEDPDFTWDRIQEEPGDEYRANPMRFVQNLQTSVEGDWPAQRQFVVVGNERARYLLWVSRMEDILGERDWSVEAYMQAKGDSR